jgi:hypothetical protein
MRPHEVVLLCPWQWSNIQKQRCIFRVCQTSKSTFDASVMFHGLQIAHEEHCSLDQERRAHLHHYFMTKRQTESDVSIKAMVNSDTTRNGRITSTRDKMHVARMPLRRASVREDYTMQEESPEE